MRILIITSQGHWLNGWMTQPTSLKTVVELLKKSGLEVETKEVSNIVELQSVLESVKSSTLIWSNAYWVNGNKGKLFSLIETIEKYELPLIGSGLKTLNQLLEKDTCQIKMKAAGIPVPSNITLNQQDKNNVEEIISKSRIDFPLVLKPTKESRSLGVTLVHNFSEAVTAATAILKKFPNSNLIIEEFLATDDITCGYLQMGDRKMILPSYNVVEGMDCKTEVFSQYHYTLPPEGEKQVCIKDPSILNQLTIHLPAIVDLFGIQTTTRIDGRLDKDGIMKFFDINGLPGLNYPISALIKQCFSHFRGHRQTYIYECLIHTIIGDSLLRYNMPMVPKIDGRNLFNLESETIISVEELSIEKSI